MRKVGIGSSGYLVGEYVPSAKLTFEKVAELRGLRRDRGLTFTALGAMFGISRSAAARACKGETWSSPVVKMCAQLEAADVPSISAGEGRYLLSMKAEATRASVARAMKHAGVTWDGKVRKEKHSHCPRGHALEGGNLTARKDGRQGCRECARARGREFASKKRAQKKAAQASA